MTQDEADNQGSTGYENNECLEHKDPHGVRFTRGYCPDCLRYEIWALEMSLTNLSFEHISLLEAANKQCKVVKTVLDRWYNYNTSSRRKALIKSTGRLLDALWGDLPKNKTWKRPRIKQLEWPADCRARNKARASGMRFI